MSNPKSFQFLAFLVLIAASLVACVALAGAPDVAPPATVPAAIPATVASTFAPQSAASALPKPGKWSAKADFGDFEFYVNAAGTGIPHLVFPGVDVKTDDETGYPIKNGQFKIYLEWIRLTGVFDRSGASASGVWEYVAKGGSGTWTATPAE